MIKYRLGILVLTLGAATAFAGGSFQLTSPTPENESDFGFRALASAGDVSGDGTPDIVVGAARAQGTGLAYVYSGLSGLLIATLGSPDGEFGGRFGNGVAGIGDVNGDGKPEIAVAASNESLGDEEDPASQINQAGRVYIFSNAGGAFSVIATLESPSPEAQGLFGSAIARVSDFTRDGVDELLVGAPRESFDASTTASGRAYLFDGKTLALITTFEADRPETGAQFGFSVAGLTDINNDRRGDVAIGAPNEDSGGVLNSGAIYVFRSRISFSGAEPDYLSLFRVDSPNKIANGIFGLQIGSVPDINGNGSTEILAGGSKELNDVKGVAAFSGHAYAFDGFTGGLIFQIDPPRPANSGAFGFYMDGLADTDGNGAPEILIAATGEPVSCRGVSGRVYLYDTANAKQGAPDLINEFVSPTPEDFGQFGFTLARLPDINRDGRDDLAITSYFEDAGGVPDAGKVYVFTSPHDTPGSDVVLSACLTTCAGQPTNEDDGDGLSPCVEACLDTRDDQVDTDFDGIPDGFEAEFGLDPLRDDSQSDQDGDGLTAIEEFLLNSSPIDTNSPSTTVFVAFDGFNDTAPGRGGPVFPYRDIAFAIQHANPTEDAPVRVVVRCGDYPEELTLKPFLSLEAAPGDDVSLSGLVVGAEGSALKNFTISIPAAASDEALLTINNVAMTVSLVKFIGSPDATGIDLINTNGSVVSIEQCLFSNVATGLNIDGEIPDVRRCVFESNATTGVRVTNTSKVKGAATRGIGDATDPDTGWNIWRNTENFAVINETPDIVAVESNDWNTNDAAAIDAIIDGPSDFEPFLAAGNGLLAASLFCTVWNAADQVRLTGAAVTLAPSGYPPIEDNTDGVYTFAAIQSGQYNVTAQATGFDPVTVPVTVADGELASIIIPMAVPPAPTGCNAGNAKVAGMGLGDMGVFALGAFIMLIAGRRRMFQ